MLNLVTGHGEHYFKVIEDDMMGAMNTKTDEKFLQSHKSILSSKTNEENLANFARWEPGHGRFRLRYPWTQYVKIGALARQCAYHIETLTGFINTEIKAPIEFRRKIKDTCIKMSIESSKALREMSSSIEKMVQPKQVDIHVENSKQAANELQNILKSMINGSENIIALIPDATVASILINITDCVEKISESVHELAKLAHFEDVEPTVSPEMAKTTTITTTMTTTTTKLHRGIVNPMFDDGDRNEVECVDVIICDDKSCTKGVTNKCSNNVNINVGPPPIVTCV